MEVLAQCSLGSNTPLGLIFDELEKKLIAISDDKLYYFDIEKILDSSSSESIEQIKEVEFYNSVEFGGNIRTISINKSLNGSESSTRNYYFLVNCKDYPVKVCNFDGKVQACIYLKNDFDEIDNIYSLDFTHSATHSILLGGGKNRVQICDLNRAKDPTCIKLNLKQQTHQNSRRQKGIISTLSLKTTGIGSFSVFASGSFSRTIFLHDINDPKSQVQLSDTQQELRAVTELYWLGDKQAPRETQNIDYHIISGHRNCNYLYLWDVRKPNKVLWEIKRENRGSNQRFSVDIRNNISTNELLLTYGDSGGNLNINKLKFNYERCEFQEVKYSEIKLENQSLPFVRNLQTLGLLATLSGERFPEEENSNGKPCVFRILRNKS
ncbi:putative guanine nucleotide-binding protein [Cryptosporidium felis]|nr:putative guanine nucleotide-binding protein [Cryptosporidium felis]